MAFGRSTRKRLWNPNGRVNLSGARRLRLEPMQRLREELECSAWRKEKRMTIYVGIGGWNFEAWRGSFYPKGLTQKRELAYAASKLSAIEINATYYGLQRPESFARWHDETPEDFMFALKGPRFATNRRDLSQAGPSIALFFESGVMRLKRKLGPINWQFMPTKRCDLDNFAAFLKLLPKKLDGMRIRHAVEVRHESFVCKEFVALCRDHQIAIVLAGDSAFPLIADVTSDFIYVRAMGTSKSQKLGYSRAEIGKWAARARAWSGAKAPADLEPLLPQTRAKNAKSRDVFLFVIAGAKAKNPAAAQAILAKTAAQNEGSPSLQTKSQPRH